MADYSPTIINESDIRNFFTPPLDSSDISTAEILLKIEATEKYVEYVYGLTSASDARIAVMLLVASKIVANPSLAKKYYTLSSESLGDYAYTLAEPISRGTNIQSSPFVLASTWESMAFEILEAKSKRRYTYKIVND